MAETSPTRIDGDPETSVKAPITVVEAPPEEPKQEVDENEQNESEELKICSSSRNVLKPSKLNPFANSRAEKVEENGIQSPMGRESPEPSTSSTKGHDVDKEKPSEKPSRGILKPPQLSVNSTFALNPSRLNVSSTTDDKGNHSNGETTLKFVPLITSEPKSNLTQSINAEANATNCGFVFGQNLQERAVTAAENEPKPSTSLHSNGTEMLFSAAVKTDTKSGDGPSKEAKTLSESAREYEELRANKRKYGEVEVITGEEGETNILNINCKLFAFDKASGSWQERGRGVLRLNDIEDENVQSRLVFRTTGSLRVVLNTKVWADMTVEQASEKSVRFTAMDSSGAIKVFLAMASMEDSKQLYGQLKQRVQKEIASQKHRKVSDEN